MRHILVAALLVFGCNKKGASTSAPTSSAGSTAGSTAGSVAGSAAKPGKPAPAASSAASSSAPAAPAAAAFKVGDRVEGQWTNGDWYDGKIGKINADGTYRVDYDDGDVSPSLTA